MLKTISPLISPELLKVLAEMGHGDEIIFLLILFCHCSAHEGGEMDSYAPPVVMMAAVEGDALDPTVEQRYRQALSAQAPCPDIVRIDRFAFYDRAQKAFAIVITGECAKYGNILLKKGVTP